MVASSCVLLSNDQLLGELLQLRYYHRSGLSLMITLLMLIIMISCSRQTLKYRTCRRDYHCLLLQICGRAWILTSLRFGRFHCRHHLLMGLLSGGSRLIESCGDGFLHSR